MPQSLAKVYVHAIFSTKNREPWIARSLNPRLIQYFGGILRDLGSTPIEINSEPDHVHLMFLLSRTVTIADTLMHVKKGSSKWIKEVEPTLQSFHWQSGYGIFSVSESKAPVVKRYIQQQEEHHKTETFQDEFRRWLKEYQVEFDERYVWD